MEIRQLRHFIAAVEAGNLRQASENIHISHPALSMSIKNLETDLGVQLLNKGRKGVAMTYAGEQFLIGAHAILRQIDDLRASLQGTQKSPSGNVRLGLPYGANNALAAPLFKLLLENFPDINLIIEEGNTTSLERSYDNDLLDVMITYDMPEQMDKKCVPLYIEHLYLVSAYDPILDQVTSIDGKDIEDLPIVSSPGTHSMRRTVEKYAFDNGVQLNYSLDFQSAHASLKIVEAGLAHSFAPWDLIHDYTRTKLISARKIVNPPMERTVCLVSSLQETQSAATNAIIGAIKAAINIARANDNLRGRAFLYSD
ncbi:LysR family transcriptional regulator [Pseudomaricurvus alkylphenolicus]|uniref:LysR family transcriptional regulator n=1 Tax=Pseudomaricurvus alkylphenolicus TaxID=1306991 RepID=UPI001421954D|nr:LysR family transcriptional regulator [Pseudomaricurvus alkylphenolicus]NIB41519.1 LysR family transcriptional regulator [Pseudomaricurvus alkylphenolicus]